MSGSSKRRSCGVSRESKSFNRVKFKENPRGERRAGKPVKSTQIMGVGPVIAGDIRGDAVELDVRTLRDGLVECVLRQSGVGACNGARRAVASHVVDLGVHLDVAALDLGVHREAVAIIATLEGNLRIAQRVIVHQVVDLIEIELVTIAVELLVHHVRHDHRTMNIAQARQIDNRAAEAVCLQVEVDLDVNVNVDLVVDGVFDLVLDLVIEAVVDLVVDLVVKVVVDLVVVAVLIVVAVLVIVLVVVIALGIERLNSKLGLTLGLSLPLKLTLSLKLCLQIGLLLILILVLLLVLVRIVLLWLGLIMMTHDELLWGKEHLVASKIADLLRLR